MKLVAAKLGVTVRPELMPVLGGLCMIRGQKVIFLNTALEPWDQVDTMAQALAQLPTESVFMAPQVRQLIENHRKQR